MHDPEGQPSAAATPGQLLKILGLGFGLAGAIGATIGAGILRTPGIVATHLPNPLWLLGAWLLGGVFALMGALCVAELSTQLPRAGGWCVFAGEAFGRQAGWLVGWTDWLAHCIGLAWEATTIGEYAAELIPGQPLTPWLTARLVALLSLAVFLAIQLLGLRAASASQDVLSLTKALVFLALVIACFALPLPAAAGGGASAAAAWPTGLRWHGGETDWASLLWPAVLALQAVITTYDGWVSPVYFAEEFSDPARDLPRSLIGGVLLVVVLYLLINAALLHVLPLEELAGSPLPAAEAAERLVGPIGRRLITAVALVALLGLINTVVMAAARILYGLSRDGIFPAWGGRVSAAGAPTSALLLTGAVAALLVLGGSFERLLGLGAVLYASLPLTGVAAMVRLRPTEAPPQVWRAWAYPLPPLLVMAVSLAFLGGELLTRPQDCLLAIALVASGLPFLWQRRTASAAKS